MIAVNPPAKTVQQARVLQMMHYDDGITSAPYLASPLEWTLHTVYYILNKSVPGAKPRTSHFKILQRKHQLIGVGAQRELRDGVCVVIGCRSM